MGPRYVRLRRGEGFEDEARAPEEGEVRLDGVRLGELPEAEMRRLRARIGFIHQDHRLVPNLRVAG